MGALLRIGARRALLGRVSAPAILTGAQTLLSGEAQGLGLDFTDASAKVVDTGTPANDFDGDPYDLLTYTSPSAKMCRQADGTLKFGAHNLYLNSASPANQSITVVGGASYAVTITGSVSVTASGAATGTWTAGTTTFTAATTTLTLGSTSGSGTVHVRRTPSVDTYLATGASARYALPYEWDADGVAQGIRKPEEARTNIHPQSQALGSWTGVVKTTRSADATTAPDGTTTADVLVEDATAGRHIVHQNFSATAAPWTGSVFLKQGTRRYAQVQLVGSNGYAVVVDLQDGTVTHTTVVGTPNGSAKVEAYDDEWFRVSVTATLAVTTGYFVVVLSDAAVPTYDGNSNPSYTGNGTGSVYVWGAQIEAGAFATSYIPTFGATATRAADDISLAQSKFPWNGGSGTLEIDGVVTSPTTGGSNLSIVARSGETHVETYKWVP